MDKFSFFDFLAYVIPGGTVILIFYALLYDSVPCVQTFPAAHTEFIVLPFLFISYIVGHLVSFAGVAMEDAWCKNRKVFAVFAYKRYHDAQKLDDLANQYFELRFMKNNKADEAKIKLFFHKVSDYLEMNVKNTTTGILNSQHAFFRNATIVSMIVFLIAGTFTILHWIGILMPPSGHTVIYPASTIVAAMLVPTCFFIAYTIRQTYIRYSFQMFIACTNKTPNTLKP